ncbi:PaaX family transcriptional regulator [Microbacterium caowuchunii]|uniref:PaaX family transcriptional regulator n=1 Tax=Microbacterium caowuchunii TaxID=2614638 RepID=UPI0012441059|nr:PaaX family transcriptional regulator C-terminal domain-containing protein [Microbacterium caowuchunii]QEW00216.1 PaaX family transcriptional regulator [Microbacterium caowuchunii]
MSAPETLLPRFQQGARSQQLLSVLLGDYWFARTEPIPSAALVDLLGLFDVSNDGARGAIQRLAQRGFLVGTKEGRHTAYAVTPMTHEIIDWHVRVLFLNHRAPTWDGTWTLVAYSVPEDAAGTRRMLRDQLRHLRFGALYDALWLRPGDAADSVRATLTGLPEPLHPAQLTVFTGARLPAGTGRDAVAIAFGLRTHAARYRQFLQRWEPVVRRLEGERPETVLAAMPDYGGDPGIAALRVRTSIMTEWRMLRRRDPQLPDELLGADYPLRRAVAACATVYDALGPPAESAVRRILRHYRAELAGLVTHHTFAAATSLLTES